MDSLGIYVLFTFIMILITTFVTFVLICEKLNKEAFEALPEEKEKIKEYLASFVGRKIPFKEINNTEDNLFTTLKGAISSNKGDLIDKGEILLNNNIYTIYCFFYSKEINYVIRIKIEVTIVEQTELFVKSMTFMEGQSKKSFLLPPIDSFPQETLIEEADKPVLPLKSEVEKEQQRQEKLKEIEDTPQCYGVPDSFNINSSIECELFGGKWDKPVKMSEECPFYRENPLKWGVNRFGYCKVPIGYELIGYRYFRKK